MSSIISWNVNSIFSKYPFVQLLIKDFTPSVFCLQETKLQPSNTFFLKNYSIYRHDNISPGNAKGGVLIAVSKNFYSEQITLHSPFQCVAARVWFDIPITICSIYLHHQDTVTTNLMQNLIAQLPSPFIITGDFNAHNGLWGSTYTNTRGAALETLLLSSNLALLNNGQNTRFDIYSGQYSAIDLTICSRSIVHKIGWSVLANSYTSDHFSQYIEISTNLHPSIFSPSWKYQEADWDTFAELVDFSGVESCSTATEMASFIENSILSAAAETIPLTSPSTGKYRVPWWDQDCTVAIKMKRKSWRTYNRHPTITNLTNFKIARARARQIIYQAKRTHWRTFISGIHSTTPPTVLWKRIRSISNKRCFEPIPALRNDRGEMINTTEDIAKIFADFFRASTHIDSDITEEDLSPPNDYENTSINQDIQLAEVQEAVKKLRNTAAGPDRIHSSMLKHLHYHHLVYLTNFFNHIWKHHDFPSQWKVAHIIPLYKSGKDRTSPTSYRPISLTNVLCKLFEKIVVKRLHLFLSEHRKLDRFQSGFRPKKSTTDSLIHLSQEIQTGFIHKQYTVSVFFDIEKAFDRIHSASVLQALLELGIEGNIFHFIQNFLRDRIFQVRIGQTLSQPTKQTTGTPQGSVLSPLLFILAVNDIQKCINYPVRHLLYADDLVLFARGNSLPDLQTQLQGTINKLASWGHRHGLSFAPTKTKVVNFTRKRHTPPLLLTLNGERLKEDTNAKFLGLIFDRTLNWQLHIQTLRQKCSQRLNLLKTLNGTAWGADKKCLLRLYGSHIRSILDYGSIVYSSASHSTLKKLDTIQNQALRIASGAFRTSPIASILAETNIIPLTQRRDLHVLSYYGKVLTEPDHINSYRACSSAPPGSFGHTALQLLQKYDISLDQLRLELNPKIHRRIIQESIRTHLQKNWTFDLHPYLLRTIKPNLEDWRTSYNSSRRKERILTRIRIGHTRLTHLHLILRTEPPFCNTCHSPITVIHILNECIRYTPQRIKTYGSSPFKVYDSLNDRTEQVELFFQFLRDMDLLLSV